MASEKQLRRKVINTAKKYVGIKQWGSQHKKLVDLFNTVKPDGARMTYDAPWCACFASAVEIEALGSVGARRICPLSFNCGTIVSKSKEMGTWVENDNYIPEEADWILYDWQDTGRGQNTGIPDHVGIVESVKDGIITVIEGNKGTTKQCARRRLNVGGRYIRGFVHIPYERLATKKKTLRVGSKIKIVKDSKIYGTDRRFSSVVYSTIYKVIEVSGERVVFATKDGKTVMGAVNKKDCIVQ